MTTFLETMIDPTQFTPAGVRSYLEAHGWQLLGNICRSRDRWWHQEIGDPRLHSHDPAVSAEPNLFNWEQAVAVNQAMQWENASNERV